MRRRAYAAATAMPSPPAIARYAHHCPASLRSPSRGPWCSPKRSTRVAFASGCPSPRTRTMSLDNNQGTEVQFSVDDLEIGRDTSKRRTTTPTDVPTLEGAGNKNIKMKIFDSSTHGIISCSGRASPPPGEPTERRIKPSERPNQPHRPHSPHRPHPDSLTSPTSTDNANSAIISRGHSLDRLLCSDPRVAH